MECSDTQIINMLLIGFASGIILGLIIAKQAIERKGN